MVTDDMEVLENKIDVERSYLFLHVNIIYRNISSGMSRNLINFLLCEGVIGGLQLERLNAILKGSLFQSFWIGKFTVSEGKIANIETLA